MSPRGGQLSVRGHRGDYVLGLAVFMLLAFGLIMMYNINPALSQKQGAETSYFFNQLTFVGIGVGAWAVISSLYYKVWRRLALPLLILAIAAVVAVLTPLGYSALGASRWLALGPFSFQPSELLKLALVIYLAVWFERHYKVLGSFKQGVVPYIVMLAIAGLFVAILQRDLGTMMVIALATLGMFYVAGIRLKHLAILAASGTVVAALAIMAFPHRISRFMTFLDPMSDCSGRGYHICQSLIGIGSGGLFGVGLGQSVQIYGYLPEAPNDSIFAVIGEEFGLIGSLIVLTVYAVLIYRGLEIARRAPDMFARLLAAGITLIFLFQTFINIAAMLSIVPLTGIPLPFVSYGGTSLVIMMVAAGLLFNISKYTLRKDSHADNRQRRGNQRPRFAGTSNRRRVTLGQ
ncbi:MAG TPA: putative lipid II flippase FtsW [Candidatus Saccharimonadia bacterium]